MSYKKLNINRDLIENKLKNYLGENGNFSFEEKPTNNLKIYTIKYNGELPATLNLYFNIDGTTTLHPNVGKNQELSTKIADHIKETCILKTFNSKSFHLKYIRPEDFETVIDFLITECYSEKIEEKEISHGKQIKLRGKQGDVLSYNYYNIGSLQVQGNPLMLFHDTIEIFSELLNFKDIIKQQLEFYEINLTTADIIGELKCRLPNSYSFLYEKIKSIISPSLALSKIDVELTDYSAFAFPVLRGIEGVMKQIFLENEIKVNSDGFGEHFTPNGRNYSFSDETKKKITCITTENVLCKLYKYFNKHRHAIFHIEGTISTSRILDRAQAEYIINTSLNIIDESFVMLQKKNDSKL